MTIQEIKTALITESDVMVDNCMVVTGSWIDVNQPARVLVYQDGLEITAGNIFWDGERVCIEWDTSDD